ncbi:MAG TPA: hypothetical protein VI818_07440 [Candidatus Thermoplasmatota archaeon]|nr:hypothetical protein [Candidatus Thermoplasmatota archaeon]
MRPTHLIPVTVLLVAGCYGPGLMGWGANGTTFEVMRHDGYIEVTEIGPGPMRGGPTDETAHYTGEREVWESFALRFVTPGIHAAFNSPAGSHSQEIPPDTKWPLSNLATGDVELHDRLYFCVKEPGASEYRFGAYVDGTGGDLLLWFEQLTKC